MHSVVRRDAKTATTRRCVTRPYEIHIDSESDTSELQEYLEDFILVKLVFIWGGFLVCTSY